MERNKYAEIIVDNASSNTDRRFTYLIPKRYREKIELGMRVLVPFGRGNRLVEGIILNTVDKINFDPSKAKEITSLIDESSTISKDMLELSLWMKDEYLCTHTEVLKTMMPAGITKKAIKYVILNLDEISEDSNLTDVQLKAIDYLKENSNQVELEDLKSFLKVKSIIKDLQDLLDREIFYIEDRVEQNVNKKYIKYVSRNFREENLDEIIKGMNKSAYKQIEILKFISKNSNISLKELMTKTDSSLQTVRALEEKGHVIIEDKVVNRVEFDDTIEEYKKIKLSEEQKVCVDTIYGDYVGGENKKYLLHGVTGSGKTEVYLQLIEKMLDLDKQAIVLVPEISLTPQTLDRFVGRFGNQIAILHSGLSLGERYDEWRKIKTGRAKIAVGARSAVFAPFNDLGVIIIDEEHEGSYKSSRNPKYDTIKVAEKRCEIESGILLLASATPNIETYYRAKKGEIELLTLPTRANKKQLPPIDVVDMKEELNYGNRTIFSKNLYDGIINSLKNKEQIILFLNRRGFSSFVSCRQCGFVLKCDSCDISLTFHQSSSNLRCHYCGLSKRLPPLCPDCGSKYLKHFGIGTQQVEELVKETFPQASVIRMDVDTTSRKGSHEKILTKFKNGKVDILIGTQMIAKGLDFPNVTLVGIIAADTSLNLPDFKASERTFQLLTQVGGRTGRGELDGNVVLQTYEPEHYSIQMAQKHDYIGFYQQEIKLREMFEYPPFINIINLVFSSKNERKVIATSEEIFTQLSDDISKKLVDYNMQNLLGPNPSLIYRIKDRFRYQVLIKARDEELEIIKNIVKKRCIIDREKKNKNKDVKIIVDINPTSIL